MSKVLLIDLDGVLNTYNGHYDPDVIPPPNKETKEFLEKLIEDYKLLLFTSRPKKLAENWLKKHKLKCYFEGITSEKKPAFAYIDDRCLNFKGNYGETLKDLKNFSPHWKKRI